MLEALTLTFESDGRGLTGPDYQAFFQDEMRHLGFRKFIVCMFMADAGDDQGSEVLLANADDEISASAIGLFDCRLKSFVRKAGRGFEPFNWRIASNGETRTDGAQFELSGYCLPLKSLAGQTGYLLVFDGAVAGRPDFSRLTFAAHELFTHLTRGMTRNPPMGLTLRELDCLRWTAEGKTSSEIAAIIKLSEHTVNHYLIAAARKLDCVNRVQAVAKALRMGLLE
jgi:LuxR family transcriptional regulator, quorum-sensing system regulator BjaR1